MMKRPIIWGTALVLAATLSASVVRADDKEIKLSRTYKAGDVERIKVIVNFTAGGMEGTIEETAKSTVKEIKKNGDIVSVSTVEKGHLSVAGQEQDVPEAPPTTETRTKLGVLVELKVDLGQQSPFSPEVMKLMSATSDVLFPEKPVKVGATWSTEFDNPVVKDKKASVKSTFVALDKVGDLDCWKIKQTGEFETGAGQPKMTMEVLYWLSPVDGQVVKAEGTCKEVPTQFGSMSWTQKMTRLKPEPKKADDAATAPAKP